MTKLVGKYESNKKLYFITKETKNYLKELNWENLDETNLEVAPTKLSK